MKTTRFFLGTALLLLPCLAKADKLVSVDATAGILNVEGNNGLKAYRLKPFTTVTINGSPAQLQGLKPGMKVTVTLSDGNSISTITAIGNAPPNSLQKPAATSEAKIPANAVRKIVIKGSVDGHEHFFVKTGRLWIEHKGWDKLKSLTVNGIPWDPQWAGDRSDEFLAFNPPLYPLDSAPVTIKKVDGRGLVEIMELPTLKNDQTLRFKIDDAAGGAGKYEIRIVW